MASHTALAGRLGATPAMLQGVRSDGTAGLEPFDPAWRTALRYADAVTADRGGVPDDVYAALAAAWDEGQIIEITQVIGLFAYFNRFNNALRVEITK
jgi:alkylhydroperoxidase family enzyme